MIMSQGAGNSADWSDGFVQHFDLSNPGLALPRAQWLLSLEVGEHIAKRLEGLYLCALVHHARSGIVLSWAVPRQGGNNHVNEQSNAYVIARMDAHGWALAVRRLQAAAQPCELPVIQAHGEGLPDHKQYWQQNQQSPRLFPTLELQPSPVARSPRASCT